MTWNHMPSDAETFLLEQGITEATEGKVIREIWYDHTDGGEQLFLCKNGNMYNVTIREGMPSDFEFAGDNNDGNEPWDGFNSDAEADADALTSIGWGTDEDYGCDHDCGGDW